MADEPKDPAVDIKASAVAAVEEIERTTPTPTQNELDAVKLGQHNLDRDPKTGAYKTRQLKGD